MSNDKNPRRRIRSFVKREGRLTKGQRRALAELFPRYGIKLDQGLLDLEKLFGRSAPRILEIGFGNGAALAEMAARHPGNDYLGIEVHRPGVGNLLLHIEQQGLTNIRISTDDAVEVLARQIPDSSLAAVYLFFPDPWHKKRHHKRRIVQPEFVRLVRRKLKIGGVFHLATDWADYADHMLEVLDGQEGLENTAGTGHFTPRPGSRPLTKFEQRGQRLGHEVRDLVYKRIA
ncbi:MAG TPA: tRNA (guanosine(46)-N7)-methyltransferase TrmB [Chromatiales bacterium]|nr:tRNA (guanosine(46)-N7)-methyltransferase TrmB [Chromatiales bacterium]